MIKDKKSHKPRRSHVRQTPLRSAKMNSLREAVANYIGSEGCSCCQGSNHEEHEAALAKLLRVRKYSDQSGYDFEKYQTKKAIR